VPYGAGDRVAPWFLRRRLSRLRMVKRTKRACGRQPQSVPL